MVNSSLNSIKNQCLAIFTNSAFNVPFFSCCCCFLKLFTILYLISFLASFMYKPKIDDAIEFRSRFRLARCCFYVFFWREQKSMKMQTKNFFCVHAALLGCKNLNVQTQNKQSTMRKTTQTWSSWGEKFKFFIFFSCCLLLFMLKRELSVGGKLGTSEDRDTQRDIKFHQNTS